MFISRNQNLYYFIEGKLRGFYFLLLIGSLDVTKPIFNQNLTNL